MSEFFIGQKVVCVDADDQDMRRGEIKVIKGETYTVRCLCDDSIRLSEIVNQEHPYPAGKTECWYLGHRFRPLESKAIQLFRAIASNPKIRISEDA